MQVTTVIDNHVSGTGLLAEHGLAMLISTGDEQILFDTGQGMVLAHNCQRLGIDLRKTTKIVLSHGHHDHTGGLRTVLEAVDSVDIYTHPDAFQPKYHVDEETARYIGCPFSAEAVEGWGGRLHLQSGPVEIAQGIWITGEIPRVTSFESVDEHFHVAVEDQFVPDMLWDDQSMFLEGEDGITVLLGCAHAGVINVLQAIARLAPSKPITRALGGTHLGRATPERLEHTISAFSKLPLLELATSHCTGDAANRYLFQALGDVLKTNSVGMIRQVG